MTNLESLDLRRTKATAAGVAELQETLPKCQIEWDGGVIEPIVAAPANAAKFTNGIGKEFVLVFKGKATLGGFALA